MAKPLRALLLPFFRIRTLFLIHAWCSCSVSLAEREAVGIRPPLFQIIAVKHVHTPSRRIHPSYMHGTYICSGSQLHSSPTSCAFSSPIPFIPCSNPQAQPEHTPFPPKVSFVFVLVSSPSPLTPFPEIGRICYCPPAGHFLGPLSPGRRAQRRGLRGIWWWWMVA